MSRSLLLILAFALAACGPQQPQEVSTQAEPELEHEPSPPGPPIAEPEPEPEPEPAPVVLAPLTGEGPSGAVGREARRQAALDLLADGHSAAALDLAATDPGRNFDPDLAEDMTPKVWVSSKPRVDMATVEQGKLQVTGPLDREIVRRIVRAHMNRLRGCYHDGLKSQAQLKGKLSVDFQIGEDGKVGGAKVHASKIGSTSVEACFVTAIKGWTFPRLKAGESVQVRQEFELVR